jgi:hypothetical protein
MLYGSFLGRNNDIQKTLGFSIVDQFPDDFGMPPFFGIPHIQPYSSNLDRNPQVSSSASSMDPAFFFNSKMPVAMSCPCRCLERRSSEKFTLMITPNI